MAEKKQSAVRHVLPIQPPGAASCSFGRLHTNCAAICQSDPLPHLAALGLDPCLVSLRAPPPVLCALYDHVCRACPPPPDSGPKRMGAGHSEAHSACAMCHAPPSFPWRSDSSIAGIMPSLAMCTIHRSLLLSFPSSRPLHLSISLSASLSFPGVPSCQRQCR